MLSSPESLKKQSKEMVEVDEALKQVKSPLTWFGKLILRWILPRARRAVGDREWGKVNTILFDAIF